jgi:hypothetical protein
MSKCASSSVPEDTRMVDEGARVRLAYIGPDVSSDTAMTVRGLLAVVAGIRSA